jgi:hypothetical protein
LNISSMKFELFFIFSNQSEELFSFLVLQKFLFIVVVLLSFPLWYSVLNCSIKQWALNIEDWFNRGYYEMKDLQNANHSDDVKCSLILIALRSKPHHPCLIITFMLHFS